MGAAVAGIPDITTDEPRDWIGSVRAASNGSESLLVQARTAWRAALTNAGLWGDQAATFTVQSGTDQHTLPAFAAANDTARDLLVDLQKPSLDAMHQGRADNAGLARLLVTALACMFLIAASVTLYFRRRMSKDLLRPVASLHRGVLRLRGGDYGRPVNVDRRDELGELAEAFNGMAGDLHDSHLELTYRATHDALTGLPNRASLAETLTTSFKPSGDRRARRESLLFLDIDDFKEANDTLGHEGATRPAGRPDQQMRSSSRPGRAPRR